jgi:UDP-hydrolysing UDP-N-acetyl-D-glucosamine 2-epimerase
MHLAEKFGSTWRAIEADGFKIAAKVDLELGDDSAEAVAHSTGAGVSGFAAVLPQLKPNIVVLLGDRYEVMAAAIAATLLSLPIAHIHGGEITAGAFDDSLRHAITKMACLHLVAAEPYRQRVIQMGEDPNCVFNVGAPGIDQAGLTPDMDRYGVLRLLEVPGPRHYLLVTLHPTTLRPEADRPTVEALLGALSRVKDRAIIFTGVNADPGSNLIDTAIRGFVEKNADRSKLFTSLGSERYWMALRHADAVVGNSSSGIVEAPAVGTPSVNIGERQHGRLRATSVIDCGIDEDEIFRAVRKVLDGTFQPDVMAEPPPYGRGGASARIVEILRTFDVAAAFPKHFRDLSDPPFDKSGNALFQGAGPQGKPGSTRAGGTAKARK